MNQLTGILLDILVKEVNQRLPLQLQWLKVKMYTMTNVGVLVVEQPNFKYSSVSA